MSRSQTPLGSRRDDDDWDYFPTHFLTLVTAEGTLPRRRRWIRVWRGDCRLPPRTRGAERVRPRARARVSPGDFPATTAQALTQVQFDTPRGRVGSPAALNDFRVNDDINVWQACGLGGGSLINSNVVLRPEPRLFDDPAWPEAFRRDRETLLEEGYRRAEEMLRPTPYPASAPPLRKLRALETVAAQGRDTCYRPPIAVSFADGVNHVGVAEKACTLCGQCNAGCNYGAKKTLTTNYLPDARNHGAELFTEVSVRSVEPTASGYRVHLDAVGAGRGPSTRRCSGSRPTSSFWPRGRWGRPRSCSGRAGRGSLRRRRSEIASARTGGS